MESNRLILNIVKTKCIVFGSRRRLSDKPKITLRLGTAIIQQVEDVKLLGVTLDGALSWSKHISSVVLKMGRAVGMARKCYSLVDHSLLRQIVQSLVLCHLDYCSMVWAPAADGEIRRLQVVQNKAARLVLGCSLRSNVNRMHNSLSWLTVKERLLFNTLTLLKRVITTQSPQFISQQLIYRRSIQPHNTRGASSGQFVLPHPEAEALKRSFIYRSISLWHKLPLNLRTDCSVAIFKSKLKLHILGNDQCTVTAMNTWGN